MGELFANGRIYDIPMDLVPLNESEKCKNQVHPDDLLFARQSLVLEGAGKCSIVMQTSEMTVFESHLIRIRLNKEDAYPLFYYYYFNSPYNPVKTIVSQCAQAGIRATDLSELQVIHPSLHTQHYIATILSRYDTLIENYQKQIKLLEEAAQRLYKEWFVDLRFPGYENVKMVDGLPEGWERNRVGEIGTVITGKTPSTTKKENYGGFIPFITIPDMHSGIYPESSLYLSEIGANSQSGKFIPKDSLMVSCIGTAGLVCISKEQCQTNQQINSLILNDNAILYYMFFTFVLLKDHLNNIGSNGATMTNVNKSKFENIEVILPRKELIIRFNRFTEGSFAIIKNLSSQIRLLTEARDRLLPRLMGGEIKMEI